MRKSVLLCAITFMIVSSGLLFASGSKESGSTTAQPAAKAATITFDWWTHPIRTKETKQAVALFEKKYPNVHVTMEYAPWGGYWSKLAVEIAGGNEPDVMQMDSSRLLQFVQANRLKDLSGIGIDTSNVPSNVVNLGKVNGKLYALTTSVNAMAMIYNPALFKKAGITYPTTNYTWADFAKMSEDIHQKTGVYGTVNDAWQTGPLAYYARTKGKELYNTAGTGLGVSKQLLTDWLTYWLDMQDKGGVAPAQVSASYTHSHLQDSLFVKKQAATTYMFIGEGIEFQNDLGGPIVRTLLPEWGNANKPYPLHPAMYWTISSQTKNQKAAVDLVNFLENDPQVSKIFLNERGVTANAANLKMDEQAGNAMVAVQDKFMAQVEKVATVAPLDPPGAGKIQTILKKIAQQVLFKQITPSQGAAQFYSQANSYLSQQNG